MQTAPTIVTDLLVTDAFLIKGVVEPKPKRLAAFLDEYTSRFVSVRDAKLIDLRNRNTIQTPRILVNLDRIVLAHEFVDAAGDLHQQSLARDRNLVSIRAFHVGSVNFEIAGDARPGSYDATFPSKKYFIIERPKIRGIEFQEGHDELSILRSLDYLIVSKARLSYIYDFNE